MGTLLGMFAGTALLEGYVVVFNILHYFLKICTFSLM